MTYPIPPSAKQPPNPEVVELLQRIRGHLQVPYQTDVPNKRYICLAAGHLGPRRVARILMAHIAADIEDDSSYEAWLLSRVGPKALTAAERKVLRYWYLRSSTLTAYQMSVYEKIFEARLAWIDQMIGDFS